MESADCLIGNAAPLDASGGWLVLGAKRILADADPKARHDLYISGQRHAVGKTLPAELFLAELFRAFHREKMEVPRQLAITHPTTFSPFEIAQLRQAVVQGWRRSLGATARSYDPKRLVNPELPHLIIDEASAAAFYFLYRDFLDAPGGLDMLNYLYPEGLNLLVYDCGGGTTDIALVHVRVGRGTPRKGRRTQTLEIKVLGRTGHRTFGGDDITTAVFRVLKARLASRLVGKSKVPYPEEMPEQAAALPDFLKDHGRAISLAVPTEFSRENLGLEENRRRMKTTAWLWLWAEAFKVKLGGEGPARVKPEEAISGLLKCLEAHHSQAKTPNLDKDKINAALQGIEIHREEVDELIREALGESIEYANRMIAAKLGKPDSPGGEVHRVYVVGNASRYPTVRETIEKTLAVPFIAQRLSPVRGEDLKNSVAKGASLALRLITQAQNMDIDFDEELNGKLPFDVTFWDVAVGAHRSLFREHEEYKKLTEKPLPIPESGGVDDDRKHKDVFLGRRWPGDEAPVPSFRFQFDEVIRGPLMVWYDTDSYRFKMRDEGGNRVEVDGEEIQKATYVAPVQSGKL